MGWILPNIPRSSLILIIITELTIVRNYTISLLNHTETITEPGTLT
jgi:hypothetical protein